MTEAKHGEIGRELSVHGQAWEHVHGGYFSDPAIAEGFITELRKAIDAGDAQVVVDLGGGTGFLLKELARHLPSPNIRFVNMDVSEKQLSLINNPRITPLLGSLVDLDRNRIDAGSTRFVFVMRSVLHYLRKDGLRPALRHIRSQMLAGEFFIHQTVAFESPLACRCLNALYAKMGTGKWYPTRDELDRALRETGWQIRSHQLAPSLPLNSEELESRYGFDRRRAAEIKDFLLEQFGQIPDTFICTPEGFRAYLPYTIYTCVAG